MRRMLVYLMAIGMIAMCVSATESDLDGDGENDDVDLDIDGDGLNNTNDSCPLVFGTSSMLEFGCPDYDEDGIPDHLDWNRDGDAWDNDEDDCPMVPGTSKFVLKGCKDMDGDFMPDIYDDDADGDGIRNEMERAASTGLVMYDPYNFASKPSDVDEDTIPDVLDDDADNDGISNNDEIEASRITGENYNWLDETLTPPDYDGDGSPDALDEDSDDDGWPDDVELDRGSDHLDENSNPHLMYFGVDTGIFYGGGLTFYDGYTDDALEISLSGLMDIVFEELVILLLLVPIYVGLFISRRKIFNDLVADIESSEDLDKLGSIEESTNELVRSKQLKVYHGLVLRNLIETRENYIESKLLNSDSEE